MSVRLYDDSGSPVSKAEVRLEPTGQYLYSDNDGCCHFDYLEPDSYYLQVIAECFAQFDTVVCVSGNECLRINLRLTPLSVEMSEIVIFSDPADRVLEFSRSDIIESGLPTLEAFLHNRAGLELQHDGDSGSETSVRIGGSNANQVIVLLDGRKLQTSASGTADLSSIPLHWIETVDIFRGSQTLLGGEAIGGIINIHTRQLSKDEEIQTAIDVNSHRQVSTVSRSGSIADLESFISFTRTQGNGKYYYRISEDDGNSQFTNELGATEQRLNNDLVRDQLFAKAAYRVSPDSRLELSGASDRSDRGIPGYLSPRLTPLARQSSGSHFLNALFSSRSGNVEWRGSASLTQSNRHFSDPDPYSSVHEVYEAGTRYSGSISGCGKVFSSDLAWGVQTAKESFTSPQLMSEHADRSRWESWLSAARLIAGQAEHTGVSAHAGYRVERVGDAGIIGLPKIEIETTTDKYIDGSVIAGWGRSYRAPDFYSLFWQEDQVARGNPDLKPEYSKEWTGSFLLRPKFSSAIELSVTASSQVVYDLIYWQQTFDGHWKPMNLKSAEIRTLDLQIEYSFIPDHAQIAAGTAWIEARDATDDRNTGGRYLTFRPPRTHRISLDLDWMKLHARASYLWTASRPVLATNSKWLSEYDLLDLFVTRPFQYSEILIQPGFRISNALNESYRIIRHAPIPLREISASVQLTYSPGK
ncbi:TonB-dependent receptor [bacterium]|nr:TonB-dependent receptor [bacterium]